MELSITKVLARAGFLLVRNNPAIKQTWQLLAPVKTEYELTRIGTREGDGGYLIPALDVGFDGCFSAGVADNVEFELEVASKWEIPVDLIDASVDSPPVKSEHFKFQKLFLGSKTSGQFVSLNDWVTSSSQTGRDLILKVDIEGFEYESVVCTPGETFNRFKVMIFELHSLEQLSTRFGMNLIALFISRVTENHTIVHAHANNVGGIWKMNGCEIPAGLEITLLRNDCFQEMQGYSELPHPLDRDCVSTKPSVVAKWPEASRALSS